MGWTEEEGSSGYLLDLLSASKNFGSFSSQMVFSRWIFAVPICYWEEQYWLVYVSLYRERQLKFQNMLLRLLRIAEKSWLQVILFINIISSSRDCFHLKSYVQTWVFKSKFESEYIICLKPTTRDNCSQYYHFNHWCYWFRTVVLKVRSPNQQHPLHLGTCQKCIPLVPSHIC